MLHKNLKTHLQVTINEDINLIQALFQLQNYIYFELKVSVTVATVRGLIFQRIDTILSTRS